LIIGFKELTRVDVQGSDGGSIPHWKWLSAVDFVVLGRLVFMDEGR